MPSEPLAPSRRSLLAGMAALSLPARGARGAPAAPAAPTLPVLRRGIGVSHLFGWADVRPDGAYADPPFGPERSAALPEQLAAIRGAGFDFVRLAVDPGPFLASPRPAALEDHLLRGVAAMAERGLGVIVDLHPSRGAPAYAPLALTAGARTPEFRAVAALVTRLASRLDAPAARPGARIALELMNEPEIEQRSWAPMLSVAYRAARLGSPRLPLVVGGGRLDAAASLPALDMASFAGDERLFFTFHDYEPWQFTHQGSAGNPADGFADVPYPAPASPDAMIAASEQRAAALPPDAAASPRGAARALSAYSASRFDRRSIDALFDAVDGWRKGHGLAAGAILLGEFGAHLTPYARTPAGTASRFAWLRDVREAAEARGFPWACWTYLGSGGFALAADEVGPGFDADTLRALGLPAPPGRARS